MSSGPAPVEPEIQIHDGHTADYFIDEDYTRFWRTYKINTTWWPPSPPHQSEILQEMREAAVAQRPRANILEPPVVIRSTPEHLGIATSVLSLGASHLMARAAVRHEIDKSHRLNVSNELGPEPPMHRFSAQEGLGYKPPLLQSRKLSDKELWDEIWTTSTFYTSFQLECR